MAKRPTRIDLLELDIDLRLSDLWCQLDDTAFDERWTPKQVDIVASFIRAAYGKGYCDSLAEDTPGQLCLEHGYHVPQRVAA